MREDRTMTKAELYTVLEEIWGPLPVKSKPRLVISDGRIVGDAYVVVSEDDPNWWRAMAVRNKGVIQLSDGRRVM